MSSLSARIVRDWYQKKSWLWILLPLSLVFRVLSALRRRLYRRGVFASERVAMPVIVVGNITVGGTGKTPLVTALVERLRAVGFKPGIASRGYGANPPVRPLSVTAETNVAHCGDEPLMLARRTGVPVVIDSDRVAACNRLIVEHHCDVIVTDDGLQHYRLQRDVEVVVIDAERGLGNAQLLPMGPLREPPARLDCVDYVVINGSRIPAGLECFNPLSMQIEADEFIELATSKRLPVQAWPGDRRVHAMAGIGNPQRFFDTLGKLGFDIIPHSFADHYAYTREDLEFGDRLPIIMTEKDAVKCRQYLPDVPCWALAVSARLPDAFFDQLIERLRHLDGNTHRLSKYNGSQENP